MGGSVHSSSAHRAITWVRRLDLGVSSFVDETMGKASPFFQMTSCGAVRGQMFWKRSRRRSWFQRKIVPSVSHLDATPSPPTLAPHHDRDKALH